VNARLPVDITWLGHSTVLVGLAGVRVLTDPVVTPAVAHLRRHRPVEPPAAVDAVVISHVHMDHLHPRSIRLVTQRETRVVVPAGAAGLLRRVPATRVDEVRAGDRLEITGRDGSGAVDLDAVPAQHSDRRGPHTRRSAPAIGYVVGGGGRRIYFAGDTGLFDEMDRIGPVDVALIPIWGWGSTLGTHHLNPVTAVQAIERLQAEWVVPIHWGTYSPRRGRAGPPAWLDRPLTDFRQAMDERGWSDRLVALRPGEATTID
jgi:L-ascorbate metabolism protein UlaG (beta-lactamase superfamily)